MPDAERLSPIHKSITVPWNQSRAFERFTRGIATWWPLRTHSLGLARAETVVFEGRVGGQIRESIQGGAESVWGTVLEWHPPERVSFTWHPGKPAATAQRVDLRFVPEGPGTRVELTHSGWEALGPLAKVARRGYPLGWAYVLCLYADRRHAPVVLLTDVMQKAFGPMLKRRFEKLEARAAALERPPR